MENDEKTFDTVSSQIENATTNIVNVENEFKQCLLQNGNNKIVKQHIKSNLLKIEKDMPHIVENYNSRLCEVEVIESIKIDEIMYNVSNQLKTGLKLSKKALSLEWKFDYCYDFRRRGSKIHLIKNNGQALTCNYEDGWDDECGCFFCSYSFPMKPNSGKYKIKFRINDVENNSNRANMIGVVSHKSKPNKIVANGNNNRLYWWQELYDYIGWSARDEKNDSFTKWFILWEYRKSSL